MKELKKVDVMSAGKISAILMLLLGILVGLIMLVVGIFILIYSVATGDFTSLLSFFGMFVMVMLIVVFYTLMGFVAGIIYAAVYNLIARKWGGLKIELK